MKQKNIYLIFDPELNIRERARLILQRDERVIICHSREQAEELSAEIHRLNREPYMGEMVRTNVRLIACLQEQTQIAPDVKDEPAKKKAK